MAIKMVKKVRPFFTFKTIAVKKVGRILPLFLETFITIFCLMDP